MGHLSLTSDSAMRLWVQVAALFLLARAFGVLAKRAGQPEVVGALLAGVVLGPSVLGAMWPASTTFLLPPGEGSHLLGAVSGFCLLMVLIVLGAETNLPLLRQLGRAVTALSAGSILVPLVAGSAVTYALASRVISGDRLAGAVLVGGALGVSSLPIIARLVSELGVSRRDFGQLAFATATINDIYGFLLLVGVGIGARSGGTSGVLRPVGGLLAMLALFAAFGQRSVDSLLRRVRVAGPNPMGSLSVAVGVSLAAAAAMQVFGIEAALGAFFAGVAVGRSRFQHSEAMGHLSAFSSAVFAPIYFASAGLQLDLHSLSSWPRIGTLAALLVAAVASKSAGAWLGARFAGLHGRETAALVVLLNGRGAMQVIIGTAGLRMGLLSNAGYTMLLSVSIASSVLVPPALRRLVGDWPGTEREQQRLAHEHRVRSSVLVRGQRLLVPLGIGADPAAAITVLDQAWPAEAELTVLTAAGARATAARAVPDLAGRPVRRLRTAAGGDLEAVLTESNLGYGVIGIGLGETYEPLRAESPVAVLLNRSPLPVVLAKLPPAWSADQPWQRIAVAVTGTTASRAAEELAQQLCVRNRAPLHIVHVVPTVRPEPTTIGDLEPGRRVTADAVVDEARRRAVDAGLRPRIAHRTAPQSTGASLAGFIRERGIDLLVVGARLRTVDRRPFLGHTVEDLLRQKGMPGLVVVALPEAAPTDVDQPYVKRES